MNKSACLLLFTCLGAGSALRADEVALMHLRLPKEKGVKSVAIELFPGDAPATVENFEKLVHKKFYDGQSFHRAFPHLLVQTGDPFSRGRDRSRIGTGGPGYTIPAEIHRKHGAGAVAMARLPDKINPSRVSNGSQFYICLAPIPTYDGQYTVFGHVIEGLDALDTVSSQAVDSNDNPVDKIVIKDIRMVPRETIPGAPKPTPESLAKAAPKPAPKPAAAKPEPPKPGPEKPGSARKPADAPKPAAATKPADAGPAGKHVAVKAAPTPAPEKPAKKSWWKVFPAKKPAEAPKPAAAKPTEASKPAAAKKPAEAPKPAAAAKPADAKPAAKHAAAKPTPTPAPEKPAKKPWWKLF